MLSCTRTVYTQARVHTHTYKHAHTMNSQAKAAPPPPAQLTRGAGPSPQKGGGGQRGARFAPYSLKPPPKFGKPSAPGCVCICVCACVCVCVCVYVYVHFLNYPICERLYHLCLKIQSCELTTHLQHLRTPAVNPP